MKALSIQSRSILISIYLLSLENNRRSVRIGVTARVVSELLATELTTGLRRNIEKLVVLGCLEKIASYANGRGTNIYLLTQTACASLESNVSRARSFAYDYSDVPF